MVQSRVCGHTSKGTTWAEEGRTSGRAALSCLINLSRLNRHSHLNQAPSPRGPVCPTRLFFASPRHVLPRSPQVASIMDLPASRNLYLDIIPSAAWSLGQGGPLNNIERQVFCATTSGSQPLGGKGIQGFGATWSSRWPLCFLCEIMRKGKTAFRLSAHKQRAASLVCRAALSQFPGFFCLG